MFLIRSNFDIVRSDCRLVLIWIIKSLDIVEITDIESSNMICGGQSEIKEAAVLANIGAVVKGSD